MPAWFSLVPRVAGLLDELALTQAYRFLRAQNWAGSIRSRWKSEPAAGCPKQSNWPTNGFALLLPACIVLAL
ncbi:hypothetical protein RRG08_048541 [Elysia crispata]|uniref:Uncharacterized protein n=1 Tax=Elysia crispata TaxID=231223 RepID=A0AAE1B5C3_9GAST|nr:hypothetical protein RRG08_048541 [Elysia crispata]